MAACNYLALDPSNTLDGSGAAVYEEIKKLNFNSVSGNVQFDKTGSRLASTGSYVLWNHRSEPEEEAATSAIAGSWSEAEGWKWTTEVEGEEYRFSGGVWDAPADKLVEPDEDVLAIEIILALVAVCILVTVVLTKIVSKLSSNQIKSNFEEQLSPDQELQEACSYAIRELWGWIIFEQLDGLSDVANGILVIYEGTISPAFRVVIGLVGILSAFTCLNGLIKRNQILKT